MEVRSKVDQIGFRLRSESLSEPVLRELERYRLSFGDAYRTVSTVLRSELDLKPSGRPAKSTPSIVGKLRRETIRLSQMHDIAGCRIVVRDIEEQNAVVQRVTTRFKDVKKVDRRERPSNGYRAIHLIVPIDGFRVEIQVRTQLQHIWAEWCEKLADVIDPQIKYGGGPQVVRLVVRSLSDIISDVEYRERGRKRKRLTNEEFMRMRETVTEFLPEIMDKLAKSRRGTR